MQKKPTPTRWHKLDNTANIFPVIASARVTSVFRLTAILRAPIEPEILQQALESVLPYFGAFNVRMRHGLFWNYLETNQATPHIELEDDTPCSYIDPVQTDRFLFRVLYYQNRVHLETFHVLTDGTGALRFLRAICYRYLMLKEPERFTAVQHETLFGTENAANVEDGYLKSYVPAQKKTFKEPAAFHIRGERRISGGLGIVTALCSVAQLKAAAHQYHVPIGEYLTAVIMYAVYKEFMYAHGAKRPVNIYVPVNLRRIFESETATNFFSNITVTETMRGGETFEDMIASVHEQFEEKCTKEALAGKLAFTARSETSAFIRLVPLPIKNGIMRVVYEHSNNGSTLAFSNLGPAGVEPLFAQDFEGFRFLLSCAPKEPSKVTAISYGDTLALTVTNALEENALARGIVQQLTKEGIAVTLECGGMQQEASHEAL